MTSTWLHRWLDTPRQRVMPRVAIWMGALKLPKKAPPPLALASFADSVASGERFLDVRIVDGELRVLGFDWRDDYERLHLELEPLLEAAARGGAQGSVTCLWGLGRVIRDRKPTAWGADGWVKWSAKSGKLEIHEGEKSTDKKVLAALDAVLPALDAWLVAHPDARVAMEQRELFGYLDRTGRVVVAPTLSAASEMSDGLASVAHEGARQVIDADGRVVIATAVNVGAFVRGLMPIQTEAGVRALWGYADRSGAMKIPAAYVEALAFHGPLAIVRVGTWTSNVQRWITTDGALVGEPFDFTHGFSEERAWVYAKATFGCVDASGAFAFDTRFANVAAYANGLAAAAPIGRTTWGYVDPSGRMIIAPRFAIAAPFSEDRAAVKDGKSWVLIDRAGKRVGESFEAAMAPMSEGLIAVSARGRVGFLDRDGAWAIPPRFKEAFGFYEDRAYASIDVEGEVRWGHLDRSGAWAIEPTFEWTHRFDGGLAPAKHKGLFGFIDREGHWVIAPRWKTVQSRFTSERVWAQLP